MIDPPVISFDGESLLNALLYSSNKFNNKINKEMLFRITPNRTDDSGVAEAGPGPHFFCVANIKKGNKRKKEKVSKLSRRSKCYCFSNVYCFILDHLEFKYLSVFHGPSTLKPISPALPNLALICAALHQKLTSLGCVLGVIFSYVLSFVMTWFLFLFSSIYLKHVNADVKKKEFDIVL